jgi:hypothetical protein
VKGKLVYCIGSWGTEATVKKIGGIGSVIEYDNYPDVAQISIAPAAIVNHSIGETIINYIKSTRYKNMLLFVLLMTSEINNSYLGSVFGLTYFSLSTSISPYKTA